MSTACRFRFRGMPPNCATSGRFPLPRSTTTCRQARSPFPVLGCDGALIAPYQLPAWGLVLGRQGLGERLLHDLLQLPEVGNVQGQQVVLDDAPKLRLIPAYDGVVIIGQQFVAVRWFVVAHVGVTVLLDDFCGNP